MKLQKKLDKEFRIQMIVTTLAVVIALVALVYLLLVEG
jgi:hypothetical protein